MKNLTLSKIACIVEGEAPFDAQPRIEGILGFSFRVVGIVILILLALIKFLEEPMLTKFFGNKFLEYKKRVPMLFPLPLKVVLLILAIAIIAFVITGLIPIT